MQRPSKRQLVRATVVIAVAAAGGLAPPVMAAGFAAAVAEAAALAEKLSAQSRDAAKFRRMVEKSLLESVRHLPEEDLQGGLENAFELMREHALTDVRLAEVQYDPALAAQAVVDAAIAAGRTEYVNYAEDPRIKASRLAVRELYRAICELPANRAEVWKGLNIALRRIASLEEAAAAQAPQRFPLERPIPTPDPDFRGMAEPLASLERVLRLGEAEDEARTLAITGVAGAGKTMLALQFAATHRDLIGTLHVLDGSSSEALLRSFGEEFGEDRSLRAAPFTPPFPGGSSDLVVVDGVVSRDDILGIVPLKGKCRVLITANCDLSKEFASVELDGWPSDVEALEYVSSVWRGPSAEGVEELVRALDRNPLAVAQAVDYCNNVHITASEYLTRFRDAPDVVLDSGTAPSYPGNVLKAVKLSLDRLESRNAIALDVLRVCALLSNEAIPVNLFREATIVAAMTLGPKDQEVQTISERGDAAGREGNGSSRVRRSTLGLAGGTPHAGAQFGHSATAQPRSRSRTCLVPERGCVRRLAASLFVRTGDYSLMRPRLGSIIGGHVLSVVMAAYRIPIWGDALQIMSWSALNALTTYGADEDFQRLGSTVLWYSDLLPRDQASGRVFRRESLIAVASGCARVGMLEDAEHLCTELVDGLDPDESDLEYWLFAVARIARLAESKELAERILSRIASDLYALLGKTRIGEWHSSVCTTPQETLTMTQAILRRRLSQWTTWRGVLCALQCCLSGATTIRRTVNGKPYVSFCVTVRGRKASSISPDPDLI